MAIITFWNDGRVETGQSMTIASVAMTLALNYNYKILLINSKYNDMSLERAFEPKNNVNSLFSRGKTELDTGLSGVTKAIMSNKTSPEIITNYTKVILKNLELLTEKNTSKEDFDRYIVYLREIIKLSNKYYDIVLVDLEGDIDNVQIQQILELSEVKVVTLVQNINVLDDYMDTRAKNTVLQENNVIVSLGKYDDKSKYTVKNVSKYLRQKKVCKIPYNTIFSMDAPEGKVADFFIRFKGVNQTHINAPFIDSVQEETETILDTTKKQQINII